MKELEKEREGGRMKFWRRKMEGKQRKEASEK